MSHMRPSMPDQVLCRENRLRAIKAQQAKWLHDRATCLAAADSEQPPEPEEPPLLAPLAPARLPRSAQATEPAARGSSTQAAAPVAPPSSQAAGSSRQPEASAAQPQRRRRAGKTQVAAVHDCSGSSSNARVAGVRARAGTRASAPAGASGRSASSRSEPTRVTAPSASVAPCLTDRNAGGARRRVGLVDGGRPCGLPAWVRKSSEGDCAPGARTRPERTQNAATLCVARVSREKQYRELVNTLTVAEAAATCVATLARASCDCSLRVLCRTRTASPWFAGQRLPLTPPCATRIQVQRGGFVCRRRQSVCRAG